MIVMKQKKYFYAILKELSIADTPSDFDGELMDKILIEEYKRGLITAIYFMRRSDYRLCKKTGFPYGLNSGKYYIEPFLSGKLYVGWHTAENNDHVPLYYGDGLEKLCAEYIVKSGILGEGNEA